MSETPVQIVHRHVDAMSARDLAGFMGDCADSIRVINADGQTVLDGRAAVEEIYGQIFAGNPGLKVDLIDRISVGLWVIDEHVETGFANGSQLHAVRVYRVEGGRIQSIQVFR